MGIWRRYARISFFLLSIELIGVLKIVSPFPVLVVPDGYGLSYSIGDEYIRWTITSLKRQTEVLRHYLAEAASETRTMMERAAAEASSSAKL